MEIFSKTVPLDLSDETLIQQFKAGNVDAFVTLYRRHLPAVHKRVCYVVPADDVEDVIQEIFIAALKSLPRFRGDAQFSTWLRTLTNYKVAEFYRKRNRKQDPPLAPLSEFSGHTDGNTAKMLEELICVRLALQELPQNYQEIILLRVADGLQFNEIAEVTGQSLEAVKSLFRRAISALAKRLTE